MSCRDTRTRLNRWSTHSKSSMNTLGDTPSYSRQPPVVVERGCGSVGPMNKYETITLSPKTKPSISFPTIGCSLKSMWKTPITLNSKSCQPTTTTTAARMMMIWTWWSFVNENAAFNAVTKRLSKNPRHPSCTNRPVWPWWNKSKVWSDGSDTHRPVPWNGWSMRNKTFTFWK